VRIVARELFILFVCATIAFLIGKGYYKSFRSGVLTIAIKGHTRTSRRDKEPISYWIGMAVGIIVFLIMVSATALMAFLVYVGLSGNSK
jgi:hypothetical protein